jgi:hypothetical protein
LNVYGGVPPYSITGHTNPSYAVSIDNNVVTIEGEGNSLDENVTISDSEDNTVNFTILSDVLINLPLSFDIYEYSGKTVNNVGSCVIDPTDSPEGLDGGCLLVPAGGYLDIPNIPNITNQK